MARIPERLSFSTSHRGDAADRSIPCKTRPTNRGQASPASSFTSNRSLMAAFVSLIAGIQTSRSFIKPTSRARPMIPRQSLRFGVKSTSMILSSKSRYRLISSPSGASAASSINPSCWSLKPSSLSLHNIPKDSTPRNFAFLILKSSNFAPTKAKGTLIPALALGAPHTT